MIDIFERICVGRNINGGNCDCVIDHVSILWSHEDGLMGNLEAMLICQDDVSI